MLGEAERIALDDAVKLFTENAAMHQGHRSLVGSIEPGMHADLIILDRNPWKSALTDIHNTKIKMTFIDGAEVYNSSNPPTRSGQ